jgi:hypothetical protein
MFPALVKPAPSRMQSSANGYRDFMYSSPTKTRRLQSITRKLLGWEKKERTSSAFTKTWRFPILYTRSLPEFMSLSMLVRESRRVRAVSETVNVSGISNVCVVGLAMSNLSRTEWGDTARLRQQPELRCHTH